MVERPAFADAWLRQRDEGARRIAEIEREELRHLDPVRALEMSEALLAVPPPLDLMAARRTTSGFVEQQRWFRRAK